MELTYKARGADGKAYGPVTLEQLVAWMREGRINPQTEIMRSDVDYWSPAGQYAEVQSALPAEVQTQFPGGGRPQADSLRNDPKTVAALKSSASWFYWIVGLSLVNTISAISGGSFRFLFGLGITQIFDISIDAKPVALGMDLVVFGAFIALGIFSHKRHLWAFIVGMVLYGLDALVMLNFQDWLGLGFHAFVLFCLARGLKACRDLNRAG